MHEIVTLQFGQQANYLGTHYWNTQESYFTYNDGQESPIDHDISFKPGLGADGSDTYTPRTLIYDLKGAFGTLRRENALYQPRQQTSQPSQSQWLGQTIHLNLPPISPSPYQQALDAGTAPPQLTTSTVRFWSDYNHLFYHPRSIVQLSDYELNSSILPFDKWQTGDDLFCTLDREEDLLDRDLRPLLEECDQLQGLQIFSTTDDAWGGFVGRYLERIDDELGKGCRWVFGLEDGRRTTSARGLLKAANTAASLDALSASASLHVPLTSLPSEMPRYLDLEAASAWHTSAVQAAAVESLTLPTRLRGSESAKTTFDQLEATLNNDGKRRIVAAAMSVEDQSEEEGASGVVEHDSRVTNGVTNGDGIGHGTKLDISMFPRLTTTSAVGDRSAPRRQHTFSIYELLRGQWKSDSEIESSNANSRDRFADGPRSSSHQSSLLFPILSSYPPIFSFVNKPDKVAIKASLSTSTAVADYIKQISGTAGRLMGVDERESLQDGLARVAEEYEEGWSEGDDSDDYDG